MNAETSPCTSRYSYADFKSQVQGKYPPEASLRAGPQRREDVLGHFLDGFRKTRSESNALVFSVHLSLAV